jgi:MFS family permease
MWTAVALILWAAPLTLVPAAPELVLVLLLLVVVGCGNVLFDVTITTLLQRAVPPYLLGRAFGALETTVVLGLTAGTLLAPPLERQFGPAPAYLVLGAPLAVVALAGLRGLRRLDRGLTPPSRQVALLRGLHPFALLPPRELEAVALRLRAREHPAGTVVVRQGDPGDTYLLVDSGELVVTVDGDEVTDLGPGTSFGEIALLRAGVRTATVTARTPVVLWELDHAQFTAALGTGGSRALDAVEQVARERLRRASPAGGQPGRDAAS